MAHVHMLIPPPFFFLAVSLFRLNFHYFLHNLRRGKEVIGVVGKLYSLVESVMIGS